MSGLVLGEGDVRTLSQAVSMAVAAASNRNAAVSFFKSAPEQGLSPCSPVPALKAR